MYSRKELRESKYSISENDANVEPLLFLPFRVDFIERVIFLTPYFPIFSPFFLTKVKVNKIANISKRNVVARNTGASLKVGESARYKVRFVIGNCTVETVERREKTRFPLTPPPLVYEPDSRILPVTQRAIPAIAVQSVPLVSDPDIVVRSRNQARDTRPVSQRVQMS